MNVHIAAKSLEETIVCFDMKHSLVMHMIQYTDNLYCNCLSSYHFVVARSSVNFFKISLVLNV